MTTSPGTAIRRSSRHNRGPYIKTRYMDDYQVHNAGLAKGNRHDHNSAVSRRSKAVSDRDDVVLTKESQKTGFGGDTYEELSPTTTMINNQRVTI